MSQSLPTDPVQTQDPLVSRRLCDLLLVATVLTFVLVTLGGIVCVTDSSRGCPDWPGCYGQLVPPMRMDSILEVAHRALAGLTSLAIVISAGAAWCKARSIRWVSWPPVIALVLLLAVVVFGALAVLRGLTPGLAALDLGSALLVLALMLSATVVAFERRRKPDLPDRLVFESPLARLALWTLVAAFLVLVGGVLVAASASPVRCLGWSLYSGPSLVAEGRGWLSWGRGLLVGIMGVLVLALAAKAWREQPNRKVIRSAATLAAVLFLLETCIGAVLPVPGSAVTLEVLWVTAAAAFWATAIVATVLAGLAPN